MKTLQWFFLGVCRRSLRYLFGYELIKTHEVPERTVAGLQHLTFEIVLDIGANDGNFLRWAHRHFAFKEMHCFEPLPGPYRDLVKLTKGLSGRRCKIFPHNVGLGSRAEKTKIFLHREHSMSSSLLTSTQKNLDLYPSIEAQEEVEIEIETLDDFFARRGLSVASPCLIKMDVQGFENRVIEGGLKTIAQAQVLILEINFEKMYNGQATFKEIHQVLDDMNFVYRGNLAQLCAKDGTILACDAIFYSETFINWLESNPLSPPVEPTSRGTKSR